jgi:hypothetical protein
MVDLCNYWLNATRGINVKLANKEISQLPYYANPPLLCIDGFSVSIQANSSAYCYPREDNCKLYENVELGYPSKFDDLIYEWAEDDSAPCRTVYGYVPVDVVNRLIEKHGGYDLEQLVVDKLSNVLNGYKVC